jgi:hypothetical protein
LNVIVTFSIVLFLCLSLFLNGRMGIGVVVRDFDKLIFF